MDRNGKTEPALSLSIAKFTGLAALIAFYIEDLEPHERDELRRAVRALDRALAENRALRAS